MSDIKRSIWTFGGKPLLHPGVCYQNAKATGTPLDFWGRANSYNNPRGPEPGTAWMLMKRSDLDELDKNSWYSLVIDDGTNNWNFVLGIVKVVTLNRAIAGDKNAARLVIAQDVKRIFKEFSCVDKQYNVRVPAPSTTSGTSLYYPDSLNGGALWTWQTMLDDLWGYLPSGALTGPTLPYSPDGNPEGWRFIGVNAWDAIHQVLEKIGCTTVDLQSIHIDGAIQTSFEYVRLGTTQPNLANSLKEIADRLVYDFDPNDTVNQFTHLPKIIRVFFPRKETYHGIEKDTPTAASANWEMSPSVSKDYTTGYTDEQVVPGTIMPIWDDLPALFDSTGANTNAAALQTRANELGANIITRINTSDARFKRYYCGFITDPPYKGIKPGSQISEIIWRDYGDSFGLITEIIRTPEQPARNDLASQRKATSEKLLTPDFNRNSYPIYPRVSQLVQVDNDSDPTGTELTANGDGLFPGYVLRWAGSAYEQLEACWIRPTDLVGASEATVVGLKQKDRLVGRLYGNETSGGTTLPIYLVRKGTESEVTGDVKLVEITGADGTIFSNCHTETTRQSQDHVFRARIITQSPDTQDLTDRTDVTDGADIWLKVAHAPWCNEMTDLLVGQRFLARKVQDAYTIGENTFAFYETFMEDSRLWALKPSVDWATPPYTHTEWLIDNSLDANFTAQPIDDPWLLWNNVLGEDSLPSGYGIMMGDEIYPIAMRRRANEYVATVATDHLHALTTTAILTGSTVISEAPFTSPLTITATNNMQRFAAPIGTKVKFRRDASSVTDWEIVGVARSEPMLVEIIGTDGVGVAPQLTGSTSLCVWNAQLQTPTATAGGLCGGGGTIVNEDAIWFGLVGPTNAPDPYYLSAGQKFLAYDSGNTFTPTGGAPRRLYLAQRDGETYWGIAYENWTDAGAATDYVRVRPCDNSAGRSPVAAQTHTVYLPKHAERDPNVVANDVIAYRLAMDGTWVCVSDYLDDKIGTVKMWALGSGAVPPGWAVMDGSDNAAPAGSGIDMTDKFVKGSSTAGTAGGRKQHTHEVFVWIEPHSLEATSHTHDNTLTIYPHSVDELIHSHDLPIDTPKAEGTELTTFVPLVLNASCTKGDPKGGASTDGVTSCPTGVWGPLYHGFDLVNASASISGDQLYHEGGVTYVSHEDHEPPFMTLIFIERIDNSV